LDKSKQKDLDIESDVIHLYSDRDFTQKLKRFRVGGLTGFGRECDRSPHEQSPKSSRGNRQAIPFVLKPHRVVIELDLSQRIID